MSVENLHLISIVNTVGICVILFLLALLLTAVIQVKDLLIKTQQELMDLCDDSLNVTKSRFQAIIDVLRYMSKVLVTADKPTLNKEQLLKVLNCQACIDIGHRVFNNRKHSCGLFKETANSKNHNEQSNENTGV